MAESRSTIRGVAAAVSFASVPPRRFDGAALIAQVKMAAHAATKFSEEEKQSCGRAGEALAVRGGTRRRAPSTKLSSCCPFGVYLKRSVREMALIPPSLLPPPPLLPPSLPLLLQN